MQSSKNMAPHLTGADANKEQLPLLSVEEAGHTPVLKEYRAIKAQYPDAILLARIGDFFELFGRDAELAAPIMGIALTGRPMGNVGRLALCGVPYHSANSYIRKLLESGHSVVLWDQVGEVIPNKLVKRAVTRVFTPGTVLEDEFLETGTSKRVAALYSQNQRTGLAALDTSTGDFQLCEIEASLNSEMVASECERLNVAEILIAQDAEVSNPKLKLLASHQMPGASFDYNRSLERLQNTTNTISMAGFGVDDLPLAIRAAGAVVSYCERVKIILSADSLQISRRKLDSIMSLDTPTKRNLELLQPLGNSGYSLLKLLDKTTTPMGSRLLRTRLQEPLNSVEAIETRLSSVEFFIANFNLSNQLEKPLCNIKDLERLVSRMVQGSASPRDLGAIRSALEALPKVWQLIQATNAPLLEIKPLMADLSDLQSLGQYLKKFLREELPASSKDGGFIRPEADKELSDLLSASATARDYIATLEETERESTNIKTLKVGYNRVFGYYLEVPSGQKDNVPAHYIRKQTLVNAERFITPELKEQETVVLNAKTRLVAREVELLKEIQRQVVNHTSLLLKAAKAIGVIDVSRALAECASSENWVKPLVENSLCLELVNARHPLVEKSLELGKFVANNCSLDVQSQQLMLLTGPNMAGKSTFLRQTAICVLLAQIGSYVPATSARVGIVDRIFTRVGAQDDLSSGMSTFMVEMTETASILNQATQKSLIILDEIGRGTSTYDGLSIAQAVIEHLHNSPKLGSRTLFATHYHELTNLAETFPRVFNARVEVDEQGQEITFLHTIVAGGADKSYGIHVAKLAGIPYSVINRAKVILDSLENQKNLLDIPMTNSTNAVSLSNSIPANLQEVEVELQALDENNITPLEALYLVHKLKRLINEN